MKTKLFLLAGIMVLFVASSVNGQLKYGVKAGFNLANVSGDEFGNTDSKIGGALGVFARFDLSDKIQFQPELMYSQQGTTANNVDVNINYLNVPLMFKYLIGNGINIQAGPQLGLLMSAKADDEDIKDDCKGMDLGLNIGLGYELEMGLGFDLRYGLGLSQIPDYDDADAKNSVIQLTVGYVF